MLTEDPELLVLSYDPPDQDLNTSKSLPILKPLNFLQDSQSAPTYSSGGNPRLVVGLSTAAQAWVDLSHSTVADRHRTILSR